MGEIADMMLDGVLCQGCGEYLGDGDGYPMFCAGCSPDEGFDLPYVGPTKRNRDTPCDICGKKLRGGLALQQHKRDKHNIPKQRNKHND